LLAFADHGRLDQHLEPDYAAAERTIAAIAEAGLDVDILAERLQSQGAGASVADWAALLAAIRAKAGEPETERVVREVDTVGVADFEGDGEGQARYTLAGRGDHGAVGVDTGYTSVWPDPLDEAARLVPESAAHIQDLIAFADRAGIEHLRLTCWIAGFPSMRSSQRKAASVSID
jgi:hypothetical protein